MSLSQSSLLPLQFFTLLTLNRLRVRSLLMDLEEKQRQQSERDGQASHQGEQNAKHNRDAVDQELSERMPDDEKLAVGIVDNHRLDRTAG